MRIERHPIAAPRAPFPLYPDLTERLLASRGDARDPTIAHALMLVAGYAYADCATQTMIAARAGFTGECMSASQVVDAMFVFSTAYLLKSECGRVAVLVYRGTELANVGNWLGDFDVGDERLADGTRVHAGFHRNVRATRLPLLEELATMPALEALWVTGHSLGGAMAVLFAMTLADDALARRLRAVYTYGQPLACELSAEAAQRLHERIPLHRHVLARDPIPALPVATWGRLSHWGHEYRHTDGAWREADQPTAQMKGVWHAARPILARFGSEKRRASAALTLADHGPHRYLDALRLAGVVSELGD